MRGKKRIHGRGEGGRGLLFYIPYPRVFSVFVVEPLGISPPFQEGVKEGL